MNALTDPGVLRGDPLEGLQLVETLQALDEATLALRRSPDAVPDAVAAVVDGLPEALDAGAPDRLARDPLLASRAFAGALRAQRALRQGDEADRRRQLRIALEQVRHALRDIVDLDAYGDEVAAGEIAAVIARELNATQETTARLLGISVRQLQRWQRHDGRGPVGADDARVRMVARLVGQLRHAFTPAGVPAWFERPHPALGQAPIELLDDPLRYPELLAAAGAARSAPG